MKEGRDAVLNVFKIPVVLSEEDMLHLRYLGILSKERGQSFTDSGILGMVIDRGISNLLVEEIKAQELRAKIVKAVEKEDKQNVKHIT